MVHRKVLAVFKGLNAIHNNFGDWFTMLHQAVVKQHTVAPDASDVPINGLWTDFEVAGYLPAGHATDGLHEDELVEVWTLLPVGLVKRLGAEAPITGLALKPLNTLWGDVSPEGANLFVLPILS